MIDIYLNGEARKFEDSADLTKLLDDLSLPQQRIAIELNGSVVRRKDWTQTIVTEGDQIEVVYFVGGG